MPKSKKNEAKAVKVQKAPIHIKKTLKRFIARPVAYVTLVVSAAYGIRQMLESLDQTAALILTVLFVFGMLYIMMDNE